MSERERDCSSGAEPAASVASQPDCSTAQRFAGHEASCPVSRAATCAVGIECEHGFDVCGICDRCTCRPYQARVNDWMMACFGAGVTHDPVERSFRFLEEALELVQANDCTAEEAHRLVDYVYGRPVGEKAQEVGGVAVCLAALCTAAGIDQTEAAEAELARVWTKVEKIRAKHASKPAGVRSSLPGSPPAEHGAADGAERVHSSPPPAAILPSSPLPDLLREKVRSIAERWIYRTAHNGPDHLCGGIADDVMAALTHAQEIMGDDR